MTQEEFDQEWLLSTDAAIKGAYYTKPLAAARQDGRITRVPYDPALPCPEQGRDVVMAEAGARTESHDRSVGR